MHSENSKAQAPPQSFFESVFSLFPKKNPFSSLALQSRSMDKLCLPEQVRELPWLGMDPANQAHAMQAVQND